MQNTYSWISKNFSKLVEGYGGQYVIVAAGEIFSGKEPKTLEKEAQKKYPRETPVGMPVPRREDFTCAL